MIKARKPGSGALRNNQGTMLVPSGTDQLKSQPETRESLFQRAGMRQKEIKGFLFSFPAAFSYESSMMHN